MVRAPSWPWVRGVSGVSTSSWASQLTNRSFIPPALRHHSFLWMKASGSGSSPSLLGLFSSDHIGSLVHTQPPASKGWTFIPCNQTEAKRLASSACPLCFLCFWPTETFFFFLLFLCLEGNRMFKVWTHSIILSRKDRPTSKDHKKNISHFNLPKRT